MAAAAAPDIDTGGSILRRDVYRRDLRKQRAGHNGQIWVNRLLATTAVAAALVVGLRSTAARVILNALAAAFGLVRSIYLLDVNRGFRFPAIGANLGALAGRVAVFLPYSVWPNPLSMPCAFRGLFMGLAVVSPCRRVGVKDDAETLKRQQELRAFLNDIDAPSPSGRAWRRAMKRLVPIRYFFAIGPACILGNSSFSFAGFPALWSWQIFRWILGILWMWALTFKAGMATCTGRMLERAERE